MQIGINDLDDDDLVVNEPSEEPVNQPTNEDDFITDYLKTRGIDNPSKIKFEDENNQIVERDWKDLSKTEKFNILNTPTEDYYSNNNELTDEEINLLNQIRQSNLTP